MAKAKYDYAKAQAESNALKEEIANYTTSKIKEIAEGLKDPNNEAVKELKKYFNQFAEFHNYSARNVMIMSLQAFQRGERISKVQSFNNWVDLTKDKENEDEKVRILKGSRAYKIFVPMQKIVYQKDETGEFILDRNNKRVPELDIDGKPKKTTFFNLGNVFDISQTNALEVGAIKKSHIFSTVKENSLNIDDDFVENMRKNIQDSFNLPIEIKAINNLASGYNMKSIDTSIVVLDDTLTAPQKLSVMFHELGHHIMHSYGNDLTKEQKEAEAESFAYVLSSKFGVDNNSAEYIKGYVEDENDLMRVLTNVQNAVGKAHEKLKLDDILEQRLKDLDLVDVELDLAAPQKIKENISIPEYEVKQLLTKTNNELHSTDPIDILNDLNIDYAIKKNGTQYEFRIRQEDKTPSANLYIAKDGNWKYHDFGSGESGTIENVVMKLDNKDYGEAREYSISKLGVKDYFAEEIALRKALDYTPKEINLSDEAAKKVEAIKEANKERASKFNNNTKILSIKEIDKNNSEAMQYLESRGLKKIPHFIYEAEGEIFGTKNGKDYRIVNKGLGVATTDIEPLDNEKLGVDIHFYKPVELKDRTLKTGTYGANGISIFENGTGEKLIVSESKWDMASANEQDMLNNATCIIANSTSNFRLIDEFIQDKKFTNTLILNQNDKAGEHFKNQIIKTDNLDTGRTYSINYNEDETGKDINDLLLDNVDLRARLDRVTEQDKINLITIDEINSSIKTVENRNKEYSTNESKAIDIVREYYLAYDKELGTKTDIVNDLTKTYFVANDLQAIESIVKKEIKDEVQLDNSKEYSLQDIYKLNDGANKVNEYKSKFGLSSEQKKTLEDMVVDKEVGTQAMQDIKSEMSVAAATGTENKNNAPILDIDEILNNPSARDIDIDKKDIYEIFNTKQVSKGGEVYNYWIDKDERLVFNKDSEIDSKTTQNKFLQAREDITTNTILTLEDIKKVDNGTFNRVNIESQGHLNFNKNR